MALTSLCGGLALANAKLGAAHGFAGPMGGMFHTPHGVICGRLLPHVLAVNVRALQERMPESPALQRFDEVAQILTGRLEATASDGVAWVQELCDALEVPPLADYGVTPESFPALVEKASVSSSMKGNPIKLTPEELREILAQAV
jgi:alcohol dehydrogenase class IV